MSDVSAICEHPKFKADEEARKQMFFAVVSDEEVKLVSSYLPIEIQPSEEKKMEEEKTPALKPTPRAEYTPGEYIQIIRTLATRIFHREGVSSQQEALRILEILELLEAEFKGKGR